MDRHVHSSAWLIAVAAWAFAPAACTTLVGRVPPPDADTRDASTVDRAVVPDATACPRPDTSLAPGTRDPSYNGGRFPSPRGYFQVRGATLDARGRVYVYGGFGSCTVAQPSSDLGVVRHREDGTIDPTFGDGGYACLEGPQPGPQNDEFMAGTVDARGRVYLVGYTSPGGPADATVARLDELGRLDPTFNGGRVLVLRPAPPGQPASSAARGVVADERGVYVAGINGTYGWVVRLTDDGSVDATFGRSPAAFDPSVTGWWALARSGDALWLAGERRSDGALVVRRADLDGNFDSTFGEGGYAAAPQVQSAQTRAIVALPGGDLAVAAASRSTEFSALVATAVRFTNTGALVASFARGGVYTSRSGLYPDYEAHVLAAQCDGSLLLGGTQHVSSASSYGAVERLDARGVLDHRFGAAGIVYGLVPTEGIAAVLTHPATGWIYVVTRDGNNDYYSVHRYAP